MCNEKKNLKIFIGKKKLYIFFLNFRLVGHFKNLTCIKFL